jgi:oligoendopeptidase F
MDLPNGLNHPAGLSLIVAIVLCAGSVPSRGAVLKQQVPSDVEPYVFDLTPLYASDSAWESDRTVVLRGMEAVHDLRGTLGKNAASLLSGLNRITDLRQRSANMLEYAILTSNLDVHSGQAQAHLTAANALNSELEAAVSFADYEIAALGAKKIDDFYREQPALEAHRERIHRILLDAPHLLAPQAEAVVRLAVRWPHVSANAYQAFVDSPLHWPMVPSSDGTATAVTIASYQVLRKSDDAKSRSAATERIFDFLAPYEPLFGDLMIERIGADAALAHARRFPDAITAFFHSEGMPQSALTSLISVARTNRDLLQRYQALRARAVGVSLSYADSWVSPPALQHVYTVKETLDDVVAMSAPLGAEYQARLKVALAQPWVHLPPWPQKRDTYGNWGNNIANRPTFGFMKFDGSYRSAQNLAGIATSRMYKIYMPADHPTDTRVDPAIYGNAIVFSGNLLFQNYLLSKATSTDERTAYLVLALDRLRQIMFDEAITVELMQQVLARVEKGNAPSGSDISKMNLTLLRDYYQNAEGGATVPASFADSWLLDGLPFESFEDVNFPLAMAAACMLIDKLRPEDPDTRRGFTGVRGRTGTDFSYELLAAAGVDLATPGPYESAMRRMRTLVSELERLLRQ